MLVKTNPALINPNLAALDKSGMNSKGMAVAGRIATIANAGFLQHDGWGSDAMSVDVAALYKNAAEKIGTRRPNAHLLLFLESRFAAAAYKILLEKQGFKVSFTCGPNGGRRALSMLMRGQSAFDAVLLEWETVGYGSDDLRGRDIVTLYNQQRPEMPILAIALTTSNYPPSLAIRGGADLFLRLPLMMHLPTLRRLLLPNDSSALSFPAAALSAPARFKKISEEIGSISVSNSRRQEEEIQSMASDFSRRANEANAGMLSEAEAGQLLNNISKLVAPTGKFKVHMEDQGGDDRASLSGGDDDNDDVDSEHDASASGESDLEGGDSGSKKRHKKEKKKKRHGPRYEVDFAFLQNIVGASKSMKQRFEEVSRENQVLRRFVRKLLDIAPRPVDPSDIPGRRRLDDDAVEEDAENEADLLEQIKKEQSVMKWSKMTESSAATNQLPISVLATLARYSNEVDQSNQQQQQQQNESLFAKQQRQQIQEVSTAGMDSWPKSKVVEHVIRLQDRLFRAQAELDQIQTSFKSMRGLEECVDRVASHIASLNVAKADAALHHSFATGVMARAGGGGAGASARGSGQVSASATPRAAALVMSSPLAAAAGGFSLTPQQQNLVAAATAKKKRRQQWVDGGGRTVSELLEERLMAQEDTASKLLDRSGAGRQPSLFKHRWKSDRPLVQPTFLGAFDAMSALADSICTILNDTAVRVCVKYPPAHEKFTEAARSFRHLADSVRWEHILVQQAGGGSPREASGTFDEDDPMGKRGGSFHSTAKKLVEERRKQQQQKGGGGGMMISATDAAHRRKVMLVRAMRLCSLIRARVTQSFVLEMWGRWAGEHREVRRETDKEKLRRERELLRAESVRMKSNLELAGAKLAEIRRSRAERHASGEFLESSSRSGGMMSQQAEEDEEDLLEFEQLLGAVNANVDKVSKLTTGRGAAAGARAGGGGGTPSADARGGVAFVDQDANNNDDDNDEQEQEQQQQQQQQQHSSSSRARRDSNNNNSSNSQSSSPLSSSRRGGSQRRDATSPSAPAAAAAVSSSRRGGGSRSPYAQQRGNNSTRRTASNNNIDKSKDDDRATVQSHRQPKDHHASGIFGQTATSRAKRQSVVASHAGGNDVGVRHRSIEMPQVAEVVVADKRDTLKVATRAASQQQQQQQRQNHRQQAAATIITGQEEPDASSLPVSSARRATVVGVDDSTVLPSEPSSIGGGGVTSGDPSSVDAEVLAEHTEEADPQHDDDDDDDDQQQQQQQQHAKPRSSSYIAETRRRVASFTESSPHGGRRASFGGDVKGGRWSTAGTSSSSTSPQHQHPASSSSSSHSSPSVQHHQQKRRSSRSRSPDDSSASRTTHEGSGEELLANKPSSSKSAVDSVVNRLYKVSPSQRQIERRQQLEEEQRMKILLAQSHYQHHHHHGKEVHESVAVHPVEFNPLRSPLGQRAQMQQQHPRSFAGAFPSSSPPPQQQQPQRQHESSAAASSIALSSNSMMSPRLAAMLNHQQQQHGGLVGSGFASSARVGGGAQQPLPQHLPPLQHQQQQAQSARVSAPSPQQQLSPSPPSGQHRVAIQPKQFIPGQ